MSEAKPIKRGVLAQDIMDLYYQDFVDDNESNFFDHDFFVRKVNEAYEQILRNDYLTRYAELRRDKSILAEMVSFDSRWLRTEVREVKKDDDSGDYVVVLDGKIFSFPFDKTTVGVQDVLPVKRNECNLIRTTAGANWTDKHMPQSDIVSWWTEGDKIFFDKDCCKKVKVLYVPVADAELELEQGIAYDIQLLVLQLMQGAKNGFIPDQTNDSNSLKTVQSETNKEQM